MKTILVDTVHTFVVVWEWVNKPMYELLESYENRKILLTSANEEQVTKHKISELPYEYFTLEHDPEKSDPTYYLTMLEVYWLKADEVIYFEHNPQAVLSAQSVWIESYLYDPKEKDIQLLKSFIDSNI